MRTIIAFVFIFSIFFAQSREVEGMTPCSDCQHHVVMGGADVVNYHGLEAGAEVPELGTRDHAVSYQNYTYYFLNQSNAKMFLSNPDKYVPAVGGFCAWGVAREGKNGNPSADAQAGWPWAAHHMGPPCGPHDGWAIIDGRLWCTIDRGTMTLFQKLGSQGMRDAETRWRNWFGGPTVGPINNGCFVGNSNLFCLTFGAHFINRTDQAAVPLPAVHESAPLETLPDMPLVPGEETKNQQISLLQKESIP